jgi:hypothetical protein
MTTKKNHVPHKPSAHAHRRPDDGNAFIPDPGTGPARSRDDLATELAEEFLASAISGDDVAQDEMNQEVPEEEGGPFVTSTGKQEFAKGTDASNPKGAERAGRPTPMRSDD